MSLYNTAAAAASVGGAVYTQAAAINNHCRAARNMAGQTRLSTPTQSSHSALITRLSLMTLLVFNIILSWQIVPKYKNRWTCKRSCFTFLHYPLPCLIGPKVGSTTGSTADGSLDVPLSVCVPFIADSASTRWISDVPPFKIQASCSELLGNRGWVGETPSVVIICQKDIAAEFIVYIVKLYSGQLYYPPSTCKFYPQTAQTVWTLKSSCWHDVSRALQNNWTFPIWHVSPLTCYTPSKTWSPIATMHTEIFACIGIWWLFCWVWLHRWLNTTQTNRLGLWQR